MSSILEDEAERAVVGEQPALLYFGWLLFVQLTVAVALQVASVPFGLAFTELVFFVAPVWLWLVAANLRPAGFLRLGRPPARLLALGVAVGLANFLVAGSLQAAARELLPQLAGDFDPLRLFRQLSVTETVMLVAAVGLVAPVCEEVAFRGYLQTVLVARYRGALGVVLPAVLFSAMHFDPVGLAARAEMGLVFGLMTLWAGSLWPAVAAHAVNNLLASGIIVHALGQPLPEPAAAGSLLEALATGLPAAVVTVLLLRHFRAAAGRFPDPSGGPACRIDPEAPWALDFARARPALRRLTAAALLALALFAAIGWRGAAVNFADALAPSRVIEQRVGDPEQRALLRSRLDEARGRARRGELSLGRYRTLRGRLAGADRAARDRPLTQPEIDEAFAAAGEPLPQ